MMKSLKSRFYPETVVTNQMEQSARALRRQMGISLVEILVATVLLGIVVSAGFALFQVPEQLRKSVGEQVRKNELYRQSFELFYRAWNVEANISSLTAASGNVEIRFSGNNSDTSVVTGTGFVTIPGGNASLNGELRYRLLTLPNETESFCRLTSQVAGQANNWNFSCPGGSYTGISDVFTNTSIRELPVVMLDGRLCFITGQTATSLQIDSTRNDCPTPSPSNAANDHRGMFSPPRLVVYSEDGNFSQAIFDSFQSPRERFTTSNLNYPRQ